MNREEANPKGEALVVGAFYLLPLAPPLLIPLVGVPSHLLWWAQVLPVALLTFRHGRRGAALALAISTVLVLGGERFLGGGYGIPADWETTLALTVALQLTNLLVATFALYARTSAARYQLLLQRVTLGVLRTREDGRIVEANQSASEILSCPQDQLRGKALLELLTIPRIGSMGELESMGGWSGRLEVTTLGQSRSLHAFLAAVRHPDGGGYQLLLSDRSVEVLRDQELERKSKLASLGEALAGVAHELKNPLTSIIAQAQLGQMGLDSPEEMEEALKVVEEQGLRMKEMLGELLGYSRKEVDGAATRLHELIPRLIRVHRMALMGEGNPSPQSHAVNSDESRNQFM